MKTDVGEVSSGNYVTKLNCTFESSNSSTSDDKMNNDVGHFIVSTEKSFAACSNNCHKDHRCIAFSYDESKNKCVIPHNKGLNQSFDSKRLGVLELSGENNHWNISALFERHRPMRFDSSSNSTCVVLNN